MSGETCGNQMNNIGLANGHADSAIASLDNFVLSGRAINILNTFIEHKTNINCKILIKMNNKRYYECVCMYIRTTSSALSCAGVGGNGIVKINSKILDTNK